MTKILEINEEGLKITDEGNVRRAKHEESTQNARGGPSAASMDGFPWLQPAGTNYADEGVDQAA